MILKIKILVTFIIVLISIPMCLGSCNYSSLQVIKEEKEETLPTSHGENISSLIVNSDIYRLLTKVWDIYTNTDSPYWCFPKGIYLERLDNTSFKVKGYIKADTAYFSVKSEHWKLIGHVQAQNEIGNTFRTSELTYDQRVDRNSVEAISTDQYIEIQTKDKFITSCGIKSNVSMTEYVLYNSSFETIFDK